jgi:hypothetical protein
MDRFETTPIDDRIMDLIGGFTWYSGRVADVDQEEINQAITKLIKGKDGIDMVEMIKKGIFQEGIAEGRAEGKLQETVNCILSALRLRLGEVPESIANELHRRTDLVALQSLFEIAVQCKSLTEFQDALSYRQDSILAVTIAIIVTNGRQILNFGGFSTLSWTRRKFPENST